LWVVSALALGASGCKGILKKREPEPASSQAPAAPALPAPTPAVEPPKAVVEERIPTPEDFEDEAFEKVTPANYVAELERLKKDIAP
jgi:hypothetical protein